MCCGVRAVALARARVGPQDIAAAVELAAEAETEKAERAEANAAADANAAERLRLLFGERATLQLWAETPSLVVAEAVLPLPVVSRA